MWQVWALLTPVVGCHLRCAFLTFQTQNKTKERGREEYRAGAGSPDGGGSARCQRRRPEVGHWELSPGTQPQRGGVQQGSELFLPLAAPGG